MFDGKTSVRLIVGLLTLALAVSSCASFPPSRVTEPPPPTDTPLPPVAEPTSTPTLPPLPTDTATPVVVVSIATQAPTPEPTAVVEPTDTPTSEPTSASTSTPTPLPPPTSTPQPTELLTNGNFEEDFGEDGVAVGWNKFSNGGAAFGWSDDMWDLVAWEGEHSQLLAIIDPTQNDRYVGIYQTVDVVSGQPYELTLHGLVRANTPQEQYGHRLYWGVDYEGHADWQAVGNWVELSWDQQPRVAKSFTVNEYTTVITPTGKSLTLFLRGHSKWPRYSEANFNLDGLSLRGVPPGAKPEATMPVTGRTEVNWLPILALIVLVFILFREGRRGVDRWREEG